LDSCLHCNSDVSTSSTFHSSTYCRYLDAFCEPDKEQNHIHCPWLPSGAAIGIGIQVFSQRLTTTGNAPETLSEQANLLKAISAAFPPSLWGAKAIAFPNAQG